MKNMKRIGALLLVFAMLLSIVGCAKKPAPTAAVPESTTEPTVSPDSSRQELEQIVDLLGDGQDTDGLSNEELYSYVEGLLQEVEDKAPVVELTTKEEVYDEQGAMKVPFDQAYPEVIENGSVTFAEESLLVKLQNGAVLTDGLKATGVGALECIVPMEKSSWYEAKLIEGTDAQQALEAVRQLKEVQLAELNLEVQTADIDDYKHFDKEQEEDFKKNGHNKDQWHFHHCGIPDGYKDMETEGGVPSVIVAVIDTGVDYNHEDLKDNMWFNAREIPDNGKDDDGNGYVDDYYGIDLIAGKGSANDDNGHGTHVAGIVAARNNNVGVMGIAYNVKIMPIKAAMHNGTLNQADIAKAVLYAYEMGAEVINMSFGGAASSIAVQDALATAYTRAVLVASAGNSGRPNQQADYVDAMPNYPAALSYVLGVMSVDEDGVESTFTNWDTTAFNGVEYELYAPGENILSTLPGNQYGYLNGTSMAAPIVSAMAAILRSEFNDRDTYPTKFIYGQLASTSDYYGTCIDPEKHSVGGQPHNLPQVVNLEAALTKLPKPEVSVQDYAIFDSVALSSKNNGDGVIDAGETIALGLTLQNRWGMSENTMVTVDTLENGIADPYVTITNPTVNYGSVGTYSTQNAGAIYTGELLTGWENPFIIKIADNCPNDYRITLHVTVQCENALDEKDETVYTSRSDVAQTVRSGVVLPSIIENDMVLTKDKLYIIPNATVIQQGVTVRVEPGAHIQFWSNDPADPYASDYIAYLLVNGNFLVEGTKEEPVYIYPSQLMDRYGVEIGASSTGYVSFKYADITNFFYYSNHTGAENKVNFADHCTFRMNYTSNLYYRSLSSGKVVTSTAYSIYLGNINAVNSVFYKLAYATATLSGAADTCIFVNCSMKMPSQLVDCVFSGCSNTMSVGNTGIPSVSNVYYREETGTTYALTSTAFSDVLRQEYGMEYAIFETQDEMDWLTAKLSNYTYYKLGIYYNGTEYVWSDGTQIPAFLDVNGVAQTAGGGKTLAMYAQKLTSTTSTSTVTVYEIPGQILPTEITFVDYEVDIDLEAPYQLSPVNLPVQLPVDAFIYESSDESVLTVSETGLVTPVSLGTADVYVYSLDRAVHNYVSITVKEYVPLESVSFPFENLKLAMGNTVSVACTLTPSNTTRRNVTYTSSDEAVATVDVTGKVTGVSFGTATITAKIEGFTLQLPVTVTLESIAFENNNMAVAIGEKLTAVYVTEPANTTAAIMTFASSDESIATVDENGIITGIASGTATITATANGITAHSTVTVYKKVTELTVDKKAAGLVVGGDPINISSFKIGFSPYNGEPDYSWSIKNSSVAKIENGQIIAVAPGTTSAVITDTRSGVSTSVALYVTDTPLAQAVEIYPDTNDENSVSFMVLLEDGSVYEIIENTQGSVTRTLLYENVKAFDRSGNTHMVLFEDGSITLSDPNLGNNFAEHYDAPTDYTIEGVACYTGQFFYWTDSGHAYAWGYNNESYQLGLRYYSSPCTYTFYEPTEMECVNWSFYVDNIVTIKGMTFITNSNYDLYAIGGEYLQLTEPKRIAIGGGVPLRVNKNMLCNEVVYSPDSGGYYRMATGDSAPTQIETVDSSYYSVVYASDNSDYPVYGMCIHSGINGYEGLAYVNGTQIVGITDAVAIGSDSSNNWIIGKDGVVYKVSTSYSSNPPYGYDIVSTYPLFDNGVTDSELKIVSANVSNGGTTGDKYLLLEFNRDIYLSGNLYPYRKPSTEIGWSSTTATTTVAGNTMKITFSLINNYSYQISLSPDRLMGTDNAKLSDFTYYTFIYQANAQTVTTPEQTPDDTTGIHQSVLDTTIQRIPTTASLNASISAFQKERQINPGFYGNAVLNPISTNTNVESWFRIQAGTVTAGSYVEYPLGGNYWGTTDEKAIGLQMIDYTDFITYGRLMYAPYLTEAPENTFPFVTGITILNQAGEAVTTVGNEKITVRVTFNRDMDTTIPLQVRFGSATPYGDYEIDGRYVDARTWEGQYTLSTLIENGQQYWNISGGCSATDDLALQPDVRRFGFTIDTTAAQALIMQGTATDTGIELRWTQDDFDTLMGYNVYRSTKEDGLYTRLNKTVIPAETMTFFDDTVEPGVVYYYNFTVVQTSLTESEPSGKISIMSKDTMAPSIYHSPVGNAFTGSNLVITATVTDNLSIAYTNLYYRVAGTDTWKIIRMNKLNNKYSAIIPAADITLAGVEYYIEAFDGVSFTYKGGEAEPYTIAVQEAISANALGDVDGDGVITNRDALVLLYAINDKYNMSAEEFARADLNGDGELRAAEALRILQYVSGVVGSVQMT